MAVGGVRVRKERGGVSVPNTYRHPKSPCTDVTHSTRSLSVAIWSRVLLSPALPPSHSTKGGNLPSRVLDSPRRREKSETCRRKEGVDEGEFKQACLIDVSVFSSPVRAVL